MPRGDSFSAPARVRQLVTPEGVPLDLTVATLSDRAAAFLIDAVILTIALILLGILAVAGEHGPFVRAAVQIAFFLLVNGYFIWFELRWSGRTPGKKSAGIRVVSRSGGPLRADAVIARNLMRNVELFLPLQLILQREDLSASLSTAAWALSCGWVFAIALVPCFNQDRLRVGDIIAGTCVVRSPRASLLRDLARATTYAFTAAQIEIYGIYELQALEDVLRSHNPDAPRLRKAVAQKIVAKIGYDAVGPKDADRFLADFYAALRAHLERRMLFGKRKEKKDR